MKKETCRQKGRGIFEKLPDEKLLTLEKMLRLIPALGN